MTSMINRSTEEKKKQFNSFRGRKDDEGMIFDDEKDNFTQNRRFNLNTYSSGEDDLEESYEQ